MRHREQRAVICGAVVIIVALLATRAAPALYRWLTTSRNELRIHAELLARRRSEITNAPALEDSAVKVRTRLLELAPKILAGNGPEDAMASLTARVSSLAAAKGIRVQSTTPLTDANSGELRPVAIRVSVAGDTRRTMTFIGALSKGTPVLTTSDIRIVASSPGAQQNVVEELETELTIRGWYQSGELR